MFSGSYYGAHTLITYEVIWIFFLFILITGVRNKKQVVNKNYVTDF